MPLLPAAPSRKPAHVPSSALGSDGRMASLPPPRCLGDTEPFRANRTRAVRGHTFFPSVAFDECTPPRDPTAPRRASYKNSPGDRHRRAPRTLVAKALLPVRLRIFSPRPFCGNSKKQTLTAKSARTAFTSSFPLTPFHRNVARRHPRSRRQSHPRRADRPSDPHTAQPP